MKADDDDDDDNDDDDNASDPRYRPRSSSLAINNTPPATLPSATVSSGTVVAIPDRGATADNAAVFLGSLLELSAPPTPKSFLPTITTLPRLPIHVKVAKRASAEEAAPAL